MQNSELIVTHVIHYMERLGVLQNEIRHVLNTIEYYLGENGLTKEELEILLVQSSNRRTLDYARMHQLCSLMLAQIDTIYDQLIRHYVGNIERSKLNQNKEGKSRGYDWIVFYSTLSLINNKIKGMVTSLASINGKMLQLRQSGDPKYSPTPSYVKRYQNILLHDFLSFFTNETILQPFLDIFGFDNEEIKTGAVLLWTHTNSDSITWSHDSDEYLNGWQNILIKESFFALELSINYCFHIHEIAHYMLEQLVKYKNLSQDTNSLYDAVELMRVNMLEYCLPFGIMSNRPHIEYACDYLSYKLFGEGYIVSIFYSIFCEDAHIFLQDKSLDNIERKFHGNIPTLSAVSWWARLKALCEFHIRSNVANVSRWILDINKMLNWYHSQLISLVPSDHQDGMRTYVVFQQHLSEIACSGFVRMNKTKIVKRIQKRVKAEVAWQKQFINDLEFNHLFEAHILQFMDKIFGKENYIIQYIKPVRSLANIPLHYYKLIARYMIKYTNSQSEIENNKLFKAIGECPVPSGRLFRHIARYYGTKEKNNLFIPNTNKDKLDRSKFPPKFCELGMFKYRIDQKNYTKKDRTGVVLNNHIWDQATAYTNFNDNERDAYIGLGSYNLYLFESNASAKRFQEKNIEDGMCWPPRFDFPYFVNTHSLVLLNNKNRDYDINGYFSCLMQIKLDSKYSKESFNSIVHDSKAILDHNFSNFKWKMYSSAGWEDILILIDHLSLKDVRELKAMFFPCKHVEKTMTHILFKNNIQSSHNTKDYQLCDIPVNIVTTLRTRSEHYDDNFYVKVNKAMGASGLVNYYKSFQLLQGSYDYCMIWDKRKYERSFLDGYIKLTNDREIMQYFTDISTMFIVSESGTEESRKIS